MLFFNIFLTFITFNIYPKFPVANSYVNDYARLFSKETSITIDKVLLDYEQKTGNQILILTVDNIEPYPSIEDYSINLVKHWKAGKKGIDNGLIVLIAKDEKAIRIEVGYGLEDKIPDIVAGRIIRDQILTSFKKNDYDIGIRNGIYHIIRAIGDEKLSEASLKKKKDNPFIMLILFLFLFFGRIFIFPFGGGFFRGTSRGLGGGSFGGFGGFGGGGFGGGGASGRW
jgi:uncharacterized protein